MNSPQGSSATATAIEEVARLQWFHSIDFGSFASSGRFRPGTPQNTTLYGAFELLQAMDLSAASVMDIGTYDGIVAFGSHRLGARRVVGVDSHRNPGFLLARRLLGLEDKVEYAPGLQIRDLGRHFAGQRFDVIVCAGVIYHMLMPMQAFTETRKLLADGGFLVMETPFEAGSAEALLYFNGTAHKVDEPFTYFVPTRSALTGMAQLAGYQVLAARVLAAPRRITLLLRAASRADLIDDPATPPFIVQMLKRDTCDHEFRFRELEAQPAAPTAARLLDLPAAERTIVAAEEEVRFPYHPARSLPTYGSTRFETASGNTLKL
jgi:2-polyprenyl-3-methyl-5-hydroxy-6-metoxy-1,4-benzoquinol methylase